DAVRARLGDAVPGRRGHGRHRQDDGHGGGRAAFRRRPPAKSRLRVAWTLSNPSLALDLICKAANSVQLAVIDTRFIIDVGEAVARRSLFFILMVGMLCPLLEQSRHHDPAEPRPLWGKSDIDLTPCNVRRHVSLALTIQLCFWRQGATQGGCQCSPVDVSVVRSAMRQKARPFMQLTAIAQFVAG